MRRLHTPAIFAISAAAIAFSGCGGSQLPPARSNSTLADAPLLRGAKFRVLYNFKGGRDGAFPASEDAPLIAKGGALFGTTGSGGGTACGAAGCGTVFKVGPLGAERVLYGFQGKPDGASPSGTLINVHGTWYGMTAAGGANGSGAIFAVDPRGNERVIYSFAGGKSDGASPFGRLLAFDGKLYGTTVQGGRDNLGTVFALTPSGDETVLHSFKFHDDGQQPSAGLTALKGKLYGTTFGGGTYGFGAVFSITPAGEERVVYSFKYGTDGAGPSAPLIALSGKLYGTTNGGGGQGYVGTVFVLTPSGSESVLYRFRDDINDGQLPQSALLYLNGTLYGTTVVGGRQNGYGTVFSLTMSGKERILHYFKGGPDGNNPTGGLAALNGRLYGTTSGGGVDRCNNEGCGTIFEVTLP